MAGEKRLSARIASRKSSSTTGGEGVTAANAPVRGRGRPPATPKPTSAHKRGRQSLNEKVFHFEKLWKVPKTVFEDETVGSFGSRLFNVDGYPKLSYSIFTEWFPGSSKEDVKVGLNVQFPESKHVQADYTINVDSAGFKEDVSAALNQRNFYCGTLCFNLRTVLDPAHSFFEDGQMEIIVKGTFKILPKLKKPKDMELSMVETEWFAEYSLKPDVVAVDGKKIAAHKLLLPEKFPNIAATFNTEAGEYEIKDFPSEVVKAAVAFAHGYSLPELKIPELVQLMKFAKHFGNDDLKNTVESSLAGMVDNSTVSELQDAADTIDAPLLKQSCTEYREKAQINGNHNDIDMEPMNSVNSTDLNHPAPIDSLDHGNTSFDMNASGKPNPDYPMEGESHSHTMDTSNSENATVKPATDKNPMVATADVPSTLVKPGPDDAINGEKSSNTMDTSNAQNVTIKPENSSIAAAGVPNAVVEPKHGDADTEDLPSDMNDLSSRPLVVQPEPIDRMDTEDVRMVTSHVHIAVIEEEAIRSPIVDAACDVPMNLNAVIQPDIEEGELSSYSRLLDTLF